MINQVSDSVSVVIDGVTFQTNQIHENVNATLKALTEWDLQDLQRHGSTSNFALDAYDPPATYCPQSLDNLLTSAFISVNQNGGEFGLSNTYTNAGDKERALCTSVATAAGKTDYTGTLAADITGSVSNASAVAKPQVHVASGVDVGVVEPFYAAHYDSLCKYLRLFQEMTDEQKR